MKTSDRSLEVSCSGHAAFAPQLTGKYPFAGQWTAFEGKFINAGKAAPFCKSRFVCGGFHEHPSVAALHPPIDAVLLATFAEQEFGGEQTI
jgi:hypothetical protein